MCFVVAEVPHGNEVWMNGYLRIVALVSALAVPASASALENISENVLGMALGFALGAQPLPTHDGEPAPAIPPTPPPGQAAAPLSADPAVPATESGPPAAAR